MLRNVFFLCLVACISATIPDSKLGQSNPDHINSLTDQSFWKTLVDFLTKFNASPKKDDKSIPQPKSSGDFRKTKLKNDHHPYMAAIYEEISGKLHQKWTDMETEGGATIRGIEPYRVNDNQNSFPANTILEFNIETIDSLDNMKHVELCLSSASSNKSQMMMDDTTPGVFQVELILPKPLMESPKTHLSSYRQQGHVFLELTSAIRNWWNQQYFKTYRKLHLRISRIDGSIFQIDRPLVIFYYKASDPERAKDKALFGAAHEALVRKSRDVHMSPRPCNHCVYGERKTPLCSKHRRHNQAPCALHIYYISLEALQWDNLFIAPKDFQMNYCSGSCNGAMADTIYNATMHAIARAKLLNSLPEKETEGIPPPYCVPSKLKDIDSMYKDNNGNIVLKKWENIVAEQCGCS